ncbi:hypothetical protein JKP88DRAFT_201642 [Tribonema minus]|uniref:DUF1015 domain-containing protein n=1 Tax=Tribonema minus TaxID=303371 RepID=A0A836CBS0_9STRA|nr:hypothetical protein JKP88DRAFT_201642 [Tribonema minus]
MVRVQPFNAYRPPPEIAREVAAPPYDVLDSDEARDACSRLSTKTFLRVNKPEVDLPTHISQYDTAVYEKGRENLQEFIGAGWLRRDATPCLYIYAQIMGDHVQHGICAGVPVEEYAMGLIKRHEKTQVKKENDRTRLTYVQNANVGPVFLTYRDNAAVNSIVNQVIASPPETEFVADDGIGHKVWPVRDPYMVRDLQRAFAAVPCSYIADGHHRSASAFRVGEMKIKEAIARGDIITGEEPFTHFLAVLFPASELRIMEYNRVVKDLNGHTREAFLELATRCFDVTPLAERPQNMAQRRHVGMCVGGDWFELAAKPGSYEETDPVKGLDVQVLYDNLLSPVLGIGNPRTDERIKFVGGIRGSAELERLTTSGSEPWAVGFLMHPVSIEEVMSVSDADMLMAPKATWFEPKLRSGLVVRLLD